MKIFKVFIAAAVCVLLGAILLGIAIGMVGFDVKQLNTNEDKTAVTYECEEDVNIINIEDMNTSIRVKSDDVNKVILNYWENDSESYQVECKPNDDGSEVICKKIQKFHRYERLFVMAYGEYDMEVIIPEDYQGDLVLKTSNASIELSDITGDDLQLSTSNSKITIDNTEVSGDGQIDNSNGRIEVSNVTIGDIYIMNSNGAIKVDHLNSDKKLDCSNDNGSINLTVVEAAEIYTETSNASINLEEVNPLLLIECESSNGKITGSIVGEKEDFTISADTSNAKSNLDEHFGDGEKQMRISTSNAAIDVDFTE